MMNSINKVSMTGGVSDLGKTLMDGITGTASAIPNPGQATGLNFAELLGNLASGAVDSLKNAEAMSFKGIQGTASTREVVDAVMSAEQSLQTSMAIRDKLVSAFLDVTKMQM